MPLGVQLRRIAPAAARVTVYTSRDFDRDLATLVIAVKRHAILAAPKDHVHQKIAEPVTV